MAIFIALVVASVTVLLLSRRHPERNFDELKQRVRTWWMMCAVFVVALLLSRNVSIVFFALLSFMALKEYLSLIPTRRSDRRVLAWAYAAIPIQYLWVWSIWYGMFIIFIPVYMFLFLPLRMVLVGDTAGFLRAAGTIHWGLMATVFSLSHVAFLLVLPPDATGTAGGPGLVLYLVLLTEANDIAQYMWGKRFGRRKIIPLVSPNKTWEGFLGGLGTTAFLGLVLGPLLTPLPLLQGLGAGLLIGASGFVGDVTISALKRDLGIKDSGTTLPGHGGILDRVDSLTYTAPLFFHFTRYFHF